LQLAFEIRAAVSNLARKRLVIRRRAADRGGDVRAVELQPVAAADALVGCEAKPVCQSAVVVLSCRAESRMIQFKPT
jgi:hypothetical protein